MMGSKYDGEWLQIAGFLRTMTLDAVWTKEEANRIWKKAIPVLPTRRVHMEAPE